MALSTVYRVVTRYETDTSRAENRLTRLTRRTDRLGRQADRVRAKFQRMFAFLKTAAIGAATIGIGLLTRRAVQLNSEIENTEISIASAFALQGLGSFESNMQRATKLMGQFRKAAITSPGESRDIAAIIGTTAPALASVAPTNQEIVQFGTRALGAAFSQLQGNVKLAREQLLQILQGRGGADVALFQILKQPLAKQLGLSGVQDVTASLNEVARTDPRKFFTALNTSLAKLDDANKAFATTFTGLWASIQEVLNNTLLTAARPLFDFMKKQFQNVLRWAEDNHAEIEAFAKTLGEKLVKGFKLAARAVKLVATNLEVVVSLLGAVMARRAGLAIAAAIAPGGMVRGAGSFVRRNVASGLARGRQAAGLARSGAAGAAGFAGDALGEILFGGTLGPGRGLGAKFVRGVKGAPGAVVRGAQGAVGGLRSGVFGAMNFVGQRGLGGTLKAGAGALAAGGKGVLGLLATGFNGLLTVAAPLVVVLGMVVGAFRVLKDTTNDATQFLMTSWEELMRMLDVVAAQFGFEGGFVKAVKEFVDWLGTGVVGVFGLVIKGVERVVAAFSFMVAVFKGFAFGIGTVIERVRSGGISALLDAPSIISQSVKDQLKERDKKIVEAMRERQRRLEEEQKKEEEKKKKTDTLKKTRPKVDVTIQQDFKGEANPDRIAFATRDLLERSLFRNKRAAAVLAGG